MLQIPVNTYEISNECREEVVQMIVNAFVISTESSFPRNYHHHSIDIEPEVFVVEYSYNIRPDEIIYGFTSSTSMYPTNANEITVHKRVRVRGCEVNEAITKMIDAGYFFYERTYGYRDQCFAVFCRNNRLELRGEPRIKPVTSFNFYID